MLWFFFCVDRRVVANIISNKQQIWKDLTSTQTMGISTVNAIMNFALRLKGFCSKKFLDESYSEVRLSDFYGHSSEISRMDNFRIRPIYDFAQPPQRIFKTIYLYKKYDVHIWSFRGIFRVFFMGNIFYQGRFEKIHRVQKVLYVKEKKKTVLYETYWCRKLNSIYSTQCVVSDTFDNSNRRFGHFFVEFRLYLLSSFRCSPLFLCCFHHRPL